MTATRLSCCAGATRSKATRGTPARLAPRVLRASPGRKAFREIRALAVNRAPVVNPVPKANPGKKVSRGNVGNAAFRENEASKANPGPRATPENAANLAPEVPLAGVANPACKDLRDPLGHQGSAPTRSSTTWTTRRADIPASRLQKTHSNSGRGSKKWKPVSPPWKKSGTPGGSLCRSSTNTSRHT